MQRELIFSSLERASRRVISRRDTKGASGELGVLDSWGAGISSQSSHLPHFLPFPLLFVCLFLEDVISVKL